MRNVTAASLVFLGGFAIMVLEIIGARFLAKDFGGSFYVWVSQIGVILIALAVGYYVGGALADRFQRISFGINEAVGEFRNEHGHHSRGHQEIGRAHV